MSRFHQIFPSVRSVLLLLSLLSLARAEESPAPTQSPALSPAVTATVAAQGHRPVRISFLPPPIEGTVSLGIYNGDGKLVRILHQQASLDEFTIGADALLTTWDGKDDDGNDLPGGYCVLAKRVLECARQAVSENDRTRIGPALGLLWANQYLDNLWRLEAHLATPAGEVSRPT